MIKRTLPAVTLLLLLVLSTFGQGGMQPGPGTPHGSSLLTGLIASWKLDNLNDSVGGNTLTNNNTATFNTGKIGNAVYLAEASSQSLSIADNADLSTGDIDFTIAFWVWLDTKTTTRWFLGKSNNFGPDDVEYASWLNASLDRFRFAVNNYAVQVTADNFGSPPTGQWICIIVWHDAVGNTVNIQVNDGTVDSASYSGGTTDTGQAFRIGADNEPGFFHDGRIDNVNFAKRVWTAGERTFFYNGGTGREHPFN